MRNPQPERFDPDYKRRKGPKPDDIDMAGVVPLKPRTPTTPLTEEAKTDKTKSEVTERFSERKNERTEIRTEERTGQLPIKRLSRRYSFEFYDDQITALKRLKHDAEMRGEKVSLSDMARQALDEYLQGR
jgi:hypothetical protein